jgi:uncharacterized protein (UPF0332 family)
MFDREFVLSGKIDRDFSKSLHKMFNLRQAADYKELVDISPEDAEDALNKAGNFVDEIKRVVDSLPTIP